MSPTGTLSSAKINKAECEAVSVEWRPGPTLSQELRHIILTWLFGEESDDNESAEDAGQSSKLRDHEA